jgi:hypothetical protein
MEVECPTNELLKKLQELKAGGRHVWKLSVQRPGWSETGFHEGYVLEHIPAAGLRTLAEVIAALDAPQPKQETFL